MKVSVIEPVGGHGGMDYYDFGLCGGLAEAGADVVLHTCDETRIPNDGSFEVRHSYSGIYGDAPSWKRGMHYLLGTAKAILGSVVEGRRICHFHLFHVGVLQAINIAAALLFGRRVVITAHDVESFVDSLEVPALSRWVYRRADCVIAHNEISRQELIERIGINGSRIAVIPHGNYLHVLRPLPPTDEARRTLTIPTESKVLLFFGQIKDVKGLDLLLEAMPEVLVKQPNVLLLIAGKPWKSDFSAYEAMMDHLDIREHCMSHIRYISDEELPYYYAAADLVILPYRRIYQSGVVLMAMSYMRAVLVSDLPGMTEIVGDGETGLVFSQGDKDSLANTIIKALENPEWLNQLADRGYQKVVRDYDWNKIGGKIKDLYAQLG